MSGPADGPGAAAPDAAPDAAAAEDADTTLADSNPEAPVGVVLCGGASARMGTDKATLPTPVGPLAAIVAHALATAGCTEVLLVGGDASALGPVARALGLHWVPDDSPGEGPLGGIATAGAHCEHRALLVGACDLPWLDATALTPLIEAIRTPSGDAVAVYELDGVGQWSLLALSQVAARALSQAFLMGERSLHRGVEATGLSVARLTPADPASIRDVDAPGDLPEGWLP